MARDFGLAEVVPWGRSAAEYEAFFALADLPADARVLDCGGGPASFTAEWARSGRLAVATDPIYRLRPGEVGASFGPVAARMLEGMRRARERFVWDQYGSPERVVERRRTALDAFIDDFGAPDRKGRYVAARLPELPFRDRSFDLVLCSHLLFLYSEQLSLEMHVASLREMLRVGAEVRVFPLIDLEGRPSRHLEPTVQALAGAARVEVREVPFEFQRGGSRLLRLTPAPGN